MFGFFVSIDLCFAVLESRHILVSFISYGLPNTL